MKVIFSYPSLLDIEVPVKPTEKPAPRKIKKRTNKANKPGSAVKNK